MYNVVDNNERAVYNKNTQKGCKETRAVVGQQQMLQRLKEKGAIPMCSEEPFALVARPETRWN